MAHRLAGRKQAVDAARYAMVPRADVPRSRFDIVHSHKTTFDADYLFPIYVDEVLPGDSCRLRLTAFCRTATSIVPVMDTLVMETFFFFCPNRLLWTNWERFMGEQNSITDTTTFLMPQMVGIDETMAIQGSLFDHFGIWVNGDAAASLNVNALPFRMYRLVWNEFFRDQDLQDPVAVSTDDGPDDPVTEAALLKRNKRQDYFTTARPWPEKPLNIQDFSTLEATRPGGRYTSPTAGVPVTGLGVTDGATPTAGAITLKYSGGRAEALTEAFKSEDDAFRMSVGALNTPNVRVLVNDIRSGVMIQRLLEINARGGTRYAELVRAQFGVVSPDSRLQRPEYLGGGRTYVHVQAVAQTSASEIEGSTTVLGEQAGIGTISATDHGFSQSFTEHGYIIGLVNVRSELSYQHGVRRMWFRRTQFDIYTPPLAYLGEQAIMRQEIWCTGTSATAGNVAWGYQERWSEYKSRVNEVTGMFRSNAVTPLDMWHFAEELDSTVALNGTFVTANSPVERALQSSTIADQQFLFDGFFEANWVRAMPLFSIPGGPGQPRL